MLLDDEQKQKCVVITSEGNEFDITIFSDEEARSYGFACEVCNFKKDKMIGTPDIREPKFCFNCYEKINKDSEFKLRG